jgi:hypothetical protein
LIKHLLILLILIISKNCVSQDEKDLIVGVWKHDNITNHQDSIIESTMKHFDLTINNNGTFEIKTTEFLISGTWELLNSTLILTGERNDQKITKTEKMIIYSLNEEKLSFQFSTESERNALMNFLRIPK